MTYSLYYPEYYKDYGLDEKEARHLCFPPLRHCTECGCPLTENEGTLCNDCEGEAFAEDEWIESACADADRRGGGLDICSRMW